MIKTLVLEFVIWNLLIRQFDVIDVNGAAISYPAVRFDPYAELFYVAPEAVIYETPPTHACRRKINLHHHPLARSERDGLIHLGPSPAVTHRRYDARP